MDYPHSITNLIERNHGNPNTTGSAPTIHPFGDGKSCTLHFFTETHGNGCALRTGQNAIRTGSVRKGEPSIFRSTVRAVALRIKTRT